MCFLIHKKDLNKDQKQNNNNINNTKKKIKYVFMTTKDMYKQTHTSKQS